jgi:hypothetical protein
MAKLTLKLAEKSRHVLKIVVSKPQGRDYLTNKGVHGRIVLKWISFSFRYFN